MRIGQREVFLSLAVLLAGCAPLAETGIVYRPPVRGEIRTAMEAAVETYASDRSIAEVEPMVSNEPLSPGTPDGPSSERSIKAVTHVPKGPPLKLVRGNPTVKRVALTFDDGPHKGYTSRLLDILRTYGVKATFFMIGRNVDANPELAKDAAEQGIELANHTYSHVRLPALNEPEMLAEIVRGADSIEKATGIRPNYFRPPGGEYDDNVLKVVREQKLTMVLWTSDAGDFTTVLGNPTAEAIAQKVLHFVSPGGIVIMHDPMPGTLEALPKIIMFLKAQGYEFVTISELASDPKAITTGGPRIVQRNGAGVQALVEPTRYPRPKLNEAQYASSKQGIAKPSTAEGKADQGNDPRGQGGAKGRQSQVVDAQVGEAHRTQGPQEASSEGSLGRKAEESRQTQEGRRAHRITSRPLRN